MSEREFTIEEIRMAERMKRQVPSLRCKSVVELVEMAERTKSAAIVARPSVDVTAGRLTQEQIARVTEKSWGMMQLEAAAEAEQQAKDIYWGKRNASWSKGRVRRVFSRKA